MKTKLFLVLLAIGITGSAGCSDDEEKSVSVSSITLDKNSLDLKIGETAVLTATVSPENATDKTIVWTSSDSSVAAVDETGTVTAVAAGNTTVTAAVKGGKSAVCEVAVSPGEPVVGDYYYSDGTYSAELDAAKKVIGVVFWVGDPTVSDAALKREHPGCTHGLVVALDEVVTPWQYNWDVWGEDKLVGDWIAENTTDYASITTKTSLKDNMNKIIGYNNTKGIELFNADPANGEWKVEAVEEVVKYRNDEARKAPANTSDWYFPSLKELSLLCSGEYDDTIWSITNDTDMRDAIAAILATIPDATGFNNAGYWSSSEYAASSPYYLSIVDGAGYNDLRKSYSTNLAVRCVLAF